MREVLIMWRKKEEILFEEKVNNIEKLKKEYDRLKRENNKRLKNLLKDVQHDNDQDCPD